MLPSHVLQNSLCLVLACGFMLSVDEKEKGPSFTSFACSTFHEVLISLLWRHKGLWYLSEASFTFSGNTLSHYTHSHIRNAQSITFRKCFLSAGCKHGAKYGRHGKLGRFSATVILVNTVFVPISFKLNLKNSYQDMEFSPWVSPFQTSFPAV